MVFSRLPPATCLMLVLVMYQAQGFSINRASENEVLKPINLLLEDLAETELEAAFYEAYEGDESFIVRAGSPSESSSCAKIKHTRHTELSDQLSPFYRKFTEAYGIPIMGSRYVSDDALSRACYVVRYFFADRGDLRRAFYKAGGRVVIMAADEKINALPEYSELPKSYRGLRGLGGVPSIPVVVAGEERLACDITEDLLLKELAIGVVNIAISKLSPRYDYIKRLKQQYRQAMESGLWRHTSARHSYLTYLGEGVQSYSNVNGYADPPDGLHNTVNVRRALQEYDPGLTNLIVELLPCGNVFQHNCKGHEDYQVLLTDCPVQVGP